MFHFAVAGALSVTAKHGFNCASGYRYYGDIDLMIGIGTRLELPAFRWQAGVADHNMIRIDTDPTQSVRLRGDVTWLRIKVATGHNRGAAGVSGGGKPGAAILAHQRGLPPGSATIQPQMTYLNIMREVLPRAFLVEEISQVGFASYYGFGVCAEKTGYMWLSGQSWTRFPDRPGRACGESPDTGRLH